MNDLELAVRTIENIIPEMPTKALQKWLGILNTAAIKIERELQASSEHTCNACLFKEWGYRDELPIGWRQKNETVICFNHEEAEAEKLLKVKPATSEETLEELMAMI